MSEKHDLRFGWVRLGEVIGLFDEFVVGKLVFGKLELAGGLELSERLF